ncbi:unnamed protein product [Urochloa decumbens]|uniref:F-box protein AT5G49610-like beta-propeller domain-containing protein n=1 Tax=Urochloa decumbens TaxID=240449 RepID=A0ABC9FLM5_9POAL
MASAAALSDELAEQILIRFPADDPARLVRAALACKRARRLVADPGFRRRFREFHGAAPMLGFFLNAGVVSVRAAGGGRWWFPLDSERELSAVVRFVPTSPSSCLARAFDLRDWRVVDARHGRVLLHSWTEWGNTRLVVWDPITDERRGLPMMPVSLYPDNWNAAVLCSAAGCNHLDCHGKRFTVVFVAIKEMKVVDYTYSTEDDLWSWPPNHPGAQQHDGDGHLHLEPSALVGNKLYFMLQPNTEILEYNVGTREMALIQLPLDCSSEQRSVLMTMEDGGLGVATVRKSKLCLWSRKIDSDEDGGWAQRRVIDLKTLLPIRSLSTSPIVAGFANGIGVIFVQTSGALFMIDLKSSKVKKVRKVMAACNIFPYMSFCYPALGGVSKGEGSRVASSAGPCGNGAQGGNEGCDIGGGEHSHDHSSDDEATASDEDDDDGSWAAASDEDDDDGSWATVSNEEHDDDSEAMTSDEDDYEDDDCAYLASLLLFMLVTEGELP